MNVRDANGTQAAKVTFWQPYAFQTALLFNVYIYLDNLCSFSHQQIKKMKLILVIFSYTLQNAIVIDRRVRVLPLEMKEIPISLSQSEDRSIQTGLKEAEVIAKAKDLVLNTGRILTQQAGSAIWTAERMADEIGSNVINSECFSKGTGWLSGVLDKASKSLAELSTSTKGPR